MSSLFNKYLLRGTLAPFLFVTCLLTPAHATSFNWSYEFGDATVVSGMLDGDIDQIDPNIVNVTSIMGSWTGDPSWAVNALPTDRNEISFDATFFDIIAFNTQGNNEILDFLKTGTFPDRVLVSEEIGPGSFDRPIVPERWTLTPKTDPIPEPSTLLLFGTGMLGLLAWARRKKQLATI